MRPRPGNPMHFSFVFLRLNVDAFLSVFSGLVSLTTALHGYRSTHLSRYKPILLGPDTVDVLGWCTTFIVLLGISSIGFGLWKLVTKFKFVFNHYVGVLVLILVGNFIVGIFLTDFRSKVMSGMDGEMRGQLRESVISKAKFGVGYGLTESWDFLQMKMSCCGVTSYRDYSAIKENPRDQPIPTSCCVMKRSPDGDIQPENVHQCMMDAGRGVPDSIFLHAKGCHLPLSGWLLHHISKLTGLLFLSILLQAVAILYLSWQGYQKSATSGRD